MTINLKEFAENNNADVIIDKDGDIALLADSRRAIAALRAGGPSIEEVGTTGVRVEFDGHGFEARAGYTRYWLGSEDERAAQALALYIATLNPEP